LTGVISPLAHGMVKAQTRRRTMACGAVAVSVCLASMVSLASAKAVPPRLLVAPLKAMPRFAAGLPSIRSTTSASDCAADYFHDSPAEVVSELSLFRNEKFNQCTEETFSTRGAGGLSFALVLGVHRFAVDELKRAVAEDIARKPVHPAKYRRIPGSVVIGGAESGRASVDVLFAEGGCFFDVGDALYGRMPSESAARTAPEAGALAIVRRARGACRER